MPDEITMIDFKEVAEQAKAQTAEVDARIADLKASIKDARTQIAALEEKRITIARVAKSIEPRKPYKRTPKAAAAPAAAHAPAGASN